MSPGDDVASLARNEQRYRSLVQAFSEFVWMCDAEGRLVNDMPWWRAVTGQSVEEILGDGWMNAVHPDDRERVDAAWEASVRTGALFDVEYRIVGRHDERHVEVRGAPVRDADGVIREWIGVCVDVTARRRAEATRLVLEAALESERATLGRIIEQAPMAVAVLAGRHHAFRYFNRAYLALTPPGRVREGLTVAEALPEAWPDAQPLLDRAYRGEEVRMSNFPIGFDRERSLDGQRYYEFSYTPILEAGEPSGVLVVAIETTEEVRQRSDLQRRLHAEHVLAEQLQRAVLPEVAPDVPGVELAVRYTPAAPLVGVGGDWYDAIPLPDGALLLAIGDVAGRGVGAATAMAQLRSAVRAHALAGQGPGEILDRLTHFSVQLGLTDMATVALARLDPATGDLVHASAGHPPPMLVTPEGAAELLWASTGPPVGAEGDHPERSTRLTPGSMLVLYTDGLVEERDRPLDASLEDLRAALDGAPPSAEALRDRIAERPPAPSGDDVALVVCRLIGPADADRPVYYGNPAELTEDIDVVRAIYDGFAARDLDRVLRHIAPDCELHLDGTARAVGRTEPYRGHEGFREYLDDVGRAWDELQLHAEDFRVVPGSVIVLGSVSGTREGELVRRAAVWTWRLRSGRVTFLRVADMGDLVRP